jgi:hypothetical protein
MKTTPAIHSLAALTVCGELHLLGISIKTTTTG